jgi:uncharacterized protein YaiL (DUF2058 family)
LATSAQAKKAERSKRAEATSERHQTKAKKGKGATTSQSDTAKVKAKAAQQRAERAAKDKALAQQHNEKAQAKALQAQIRQLILQNDQRTKVADDDAVPYNFVHGKKIKKIFVTKQQLEALSSGRLVVVNNNGIYHFVDEKVAKQIEQRDPKRIIVAHDANAKPPEPGSDEEFYAKFEVPDDLDW